MSSRFYCALVRQVTVVFSLFIFSTVTSAGTLTTAIEDLEVGQSAIGNWLTVHFPTGVVCPEAIPMFENAVTINAPSNISVFNKQYVLLLQAIATDALVTFTYEHVSVYTFDWCEITGIRLVI